MKITWLGHSSLRIEIAGEVLLVDPWFGGNPSFPDARLEEARAGATAILLTHGHFDHASEAVETARATGAVIYGIFELTSFLAEEGVETVGFNKGGTVRIGDVAVTMVNATHSSSVTGRDGPIYVGGEAGLMIAGEGRTLYVSGDTDVMADMKIFNDLHAPDIGILSAGGHFTMDMARAAYAARSFFEFKTVIPYHYKTFPLLAQSAQELVDGLPGVDVRTPEVMEPMEF
jgi:L-ascorbate metabolism protein UlaG (beta-lactamase superfamily)